MEAAPGQRGRYPLVNQQMWALRDAFAAAGDMAVTIQAPGGGAPGESGGRGVWWPPLGRLPERVLGRDVLLDQLAGWAQAPDGRAHVLTGLGGAGKSTVALRVAEIALAQSQPVWWVSGMDGPPLAVALLGLAQALGADAQQVKAAYDGQVDPCDVLWRQLEARHGWVLVIDNADDVRALSIRDRPVRDGNGWVRGSRAGLVVVTSRDADPGHWGRAVRIHPVGCLSDEDGASVLLDLAPGAGSRREAQELSARLGGLGLALHHAGSQLGSRFTLQQTFTGYRQALEPGFPALLGSMTEAGDRQVVTRTWEVSLNQLADAGVPQARGLLEVLAWLAGAVPIPVAGFDPQVLRPVCGKLGPDGVRQAMEALLSVGLIETGFDADSDSGKDAGAGGVMVHPLVAETMRHQLGNGKRGRAAATVAVDLLTSATGRLDADRPADWPVWRAWLPHLEALLDCASPLLRKSSRRARKGSLAALAMVTSEVATALLVAGFDAESLRVTEAGLHHSVRLGKGHAINTLLRVRSAGAHFALGHVAEAEHLFRETLPVIERALGHDQSGTLAIRFAIARVVAEQGNAAEAERLFREFLPVAERVMGPDHPNTLTIRHSIAQVMAVQGNVAEAERLHHEILQTRERVLGHDDPETLATRYAIARVVAEQGNAAEAERLHREVMQAEERVLGPDHPNTMTTRHEIARMMAQQGKVAEAERLHHEILQTRERALGHDHPDTLATRHEIARVMAQQGRAAEAERLHHEILQTRERVLGHDHPDTLATRHEIALVTAEQGNVAEAERLHREILQTRERVLGHDHPDTRITMRSLRDLTEPTWESTSD